MNIIDIKNDTIRYLAELRSREETDISYTGLTTRFELVNAFMWQGTPEGILYWNTVSHGKLPKGFDEEATILKYGLLFIKDRPEKVIEKEYNIIDTLTEMGIPFTVK
jgi:hypothetical protein